MRKLLRLRIFQHRGRRHYTFALQGCQGSPGDYTALVKQLRPPARAAAMIVLAVACVYAPATRFEFVWDDHDLVEHNPVVAAADGGISPVAFFGAGFSSSPFAASPGPYYRPLSILSFALDWKLWDGNAGGFHATNLALHALASFLVWAFLNAQGVADPFALGGALLFALHPAHAEPACWISGRTDLLATSLVLGSLLAWRRRWAAGAVAGAVAFAGALFAKESAIVAPLLLAACRLGEPWRGPAGARARATIAGMLVALAGYAILRTAALSGAAGGAPALPGLGPGERVARAFLILGEATNVLFFPWDLAPLRAAPRPAWNPAALAPAAGAAGLAAMTVWCLRDPARRRRYGRPLVFFIAALLPVLGFVDLVVPFAERFLYLPSVGFSWGLAAAGEHFAGRARAGGRGRAKRAALLTAGLALALAYGMGARAHAQTWRDDPTLFRAIVGRHPDSVPAWNEMGIALAQRGELTGARRALERAIALDAGYPPAHFNLSRVLDRQGDLAGAMREIEIALRLAPDAPSVLAVRDRLRARMTPP